MILCLNVSHELPFVIRQCIYERTTSGYHVISWKRLRNESSKSVQKIPTSNVQEQETEPLTSQI